MITPDVSAVLDAAKALREKKWHMDWCHTPPDECKVGPPFAVGVAAVEAATQQACIAYAITVVEGIPHGFMCANDASTRAVWSIGGTLVPCTRCNTLAELQAIIDRAGEQPHGAPPEGG